MAKKKTPFRRPSVDEQQILREAQVKLLTREPELQRFNRLIAAEHYLKNDHVVGEHLRYVIAWKGQWLALATWSAAALHLKARDQFIGWSEEQRRQRLPLVVNNSRLCVLPACHYPNLVSRFMKLMLGRLSADWQARWGHPVALAETFVDPQYFRGTAYKVSGWSQLGETSGWKRSAVDFYEQHKRPKQIWVKELEKKACVKLRAPALPEAWAVVAAQAPPHCTARVTQILSLLEQLRRTVPEFRSRKALAYPLAGMLALIAMALFSGVAQGYADLEDYAATLSQAQLRALGFRRDRHTGRLRHPRRTTFARVLTEVDAALLEAALQCWQQQVLGPSQNRLVIFDGKTHRHAGIATVSAVDGTGRWLGSLGVPAGTTEVPVARPLLAKLDLVNKIAVADAAHTQVETVQQILFAQGGEYLLTVKANQQGLYQDLEKLLQPQRFSPCPHAAHPRADAGTQLPTAGASPAGLPGGEPGAGGLSGGAEHRPAGAPHPA